MGMVFGKVDVEQAKYDVVFKEPNDEYEVRKYHPAVAAQVSDMKDNDGFGILARYIGVFGKPENSAVASSAPEAVAMTAPVVDKIEPQPIAMTAPVVSASTTNAMQFILPAKFTMDNAPVPKNSAVKLVKLPERTYVVQQYTWNTDLKDAKEKVDALVKTIEKSNEENEETRIELDKTDWELYRYNPPFTLPFLRTNEIAIRVTKMFVK